MKRKALSLLEVLAAVVILSVVGVAVLSAIIQSSRVMQTTSHHTLLSFVTQKVVEETLQAFSDNPFADQEFSHLTDGLSIADAKHPHFSAIEDTRAPFGRLTKGADLAIEQQDETLYRYYRDFQLLYSLQEVPGVPQTFDLDVIWIDVAQSTPRIDTFKLRLANPRVVRPLPTAGAPEALDREIVLILFPTAPAGSSLATLASNVGADLALLRLAGRMLVPIREATAELSKPAATGSVSGTPDQKAEQYIERARTDERKAALAWSAALVAQVAAIQLPIGRPRLGRDPRVKIALRTTLDRATTFVAEVVNHIGQSLAGYGQAASLMRQTGTRPSRRLAVEKKILALAKVQALMGIGSSRSFASGWVNHLDTVYRNASRILDTWLDHEKLEVSSQVELENHNPILAERARTFPAAVKSIQDAASILAR